MGDKVHDEKKNNEASTVDVDTIFKEHSKKSRKKARNKESDAETKTHDPHPPPKRRKVKFKSKLYCIVFQSANQLTTQEIN